MALKKKTIFFESKKKIVLFFRINLSWNNHLRKSWLTIENYSK